MCRLCRTAESEQRQHRASLTDAWDEVHDHILKRTSQNRGHSVHAEELFAGHTLIEARCRPSLGECRARSARRRRITDPPTPPPALGWASGGYSMSLSRCGHPLGSRPAADRRGAGSSNFRSTYVARATPLREGGGKGESEWRTRRTFGAETAARVAK